MVPNKLENHIKEKLNSREIQPSSQAWDRLDAMLSVNEEKKARPPFWWLNIAAGILVLISLGVFFFTQNQSNSQPVNNIATSETKDTVQKQVKEISIPIVKQNQVVISNQPSIVNRQPTINNQSVSINNQKALINNQQSNKPNPLINRDKEIEYQNSSDVALKDLPKIETRKEIIVYRPKENNANTPTDEQLLTSLDKTAKQFVNNKLSVKVDAKSLLSQVDGELELTFREKVINKVAKNYKEVKVALANRNNE